MNLYAGYALHKKKDGCVTTAKIVSIASIPLIDIIGFIYFFVSKRVKATYADKKYHKLAVSFP
jgi:hypothetical protein